MPETELNPEIDLKPYERLLAAIFGRRESICYSYTIEEGNCISLKEGVERTLETLPDFRSWTKEMQIRLLALRFGLKDGRCRMLAEVSREFKVTRERIRQVEIRTLRLLRHRSRSHFLRFFLVPTSEEYKDLIDQVRQLKEENRRLQSEKEEKEENLQSILRNWGITARADDEESKALFGALQRTALHYNYPPAFLTRVYNGLLRNRITSLSQLRFLIALSSEEEVIYQMHNFGPRSLEFIHRALVLEEELN